jgi:acetyl esterase/lipase
MALVRRGSRDSLVRANRMTNKKAADKAARAEIPNSLGKLLPIVFVALFLHINSRAVEPFKVLDLWPAVPPGEKGRLGPEHDTTKPEDRPVAGRGVIRLSDVSRPTLTIYRPPKEKNTGTSVLVCPGGGYRILAIDLEGTEVCEWLNSIGVTAGLLKYRVPKREGDDNHNLPLQDAQRALSLLRYHAPDWGIDPERIGALGFSAGGHLAASLSNSDKTAYPRLDEIDDASSRPNFSILIYPAYLVTKGTEQLAPDIKVSGNMPPAFIAMALNDPVGIENAFGYASASRKAKVPLELHVYESGGHGVGLRLVKEAPITNWPERAADWLRVRNLLRKN